MNLYYALCDILPIEMLHWDFMKNAFLAILLVTPLLGLTSTMVVTGRMSFFSDALGHSAFTGIAIGAMCGISSSTWAAVIFSVLFALLFSFVRSRSNQAADTLIGVFSSTAIALGIFIATLNGGSFTKYNKFLIGDILSVTTQDLGLLALVLFGVIIVWFLTSNQLTLCAIHPQLAASRAVPVHLVQTVFTVTVAIIVTLAISWIGLLILNSLLVLPGAASRNIAKNVRQYYLYSVIIALLSGIIGLCVSFYYGASAGAAISLILALIFIISFLLRKIRR